MELNFLMKTIKNYYSDEQLNEVGIQEINVINYDNDNTTVIDYEIGKEHTYLVFESESLEELLFFTKDYNVIDRFLLQMNRIYRVDDINGKVCDYLLNVYHTKDVRCVYKRVNDIILKEFYKMNLLQKMNLIELFIGSESDVLRGELYHVNVNDYISFSELTPNSQLHLISIITKFSINEIYGVMNND